MNIEGKYRDEAAESIEFALRAFAEAVDQGDAQLAETSVRLAVALSTQYPSLYEDLEGQP